MKLFDPFTGFEKAVLPSGLTIYHAKRDRPYFFACFTVHAGSREDFRGKEGLAHFVEHAVSRNIPGYPNYTENERWFGTTGGYADFGKTGTLSTQYMFSVPSDEAHVIQGLDLHARMISAARIECAVEEQRRVIIEEFSRKYPDDKLFRLSRTGYRILLGEGHRMAHSGVLGSKDTIRAITRADLQAFYDRYYVPRNVTVVTAGPMPLSDVVSYLSRTDLAKDKPGERNPVVTTEPLPLPAKTRAEESAGRLFSMTVSQADYERAWALPAVKPKAVSLVARALSRVLTEEIREKRSLAYSFSASFSDFQSFYLVSIEGEVPAVNAEEVDQVVLSVLEDEARLRLAFDEAKERRLKGLQMYDATTEGLVEDASSDVEHVHRVVTHEEVYQEYEATTWIDAREVIAQLRPERGLLYLVMP